MPESFQQSPYFGATETWEIAPSRRMLTPFMGLGVSGARTEDTIKRMFLAAICVALFLCPAAQAHHGSNPPNCYKRPAVVKCFIKRAAKHHRVPSAWLTRIAFCESRFNPKARNPSGASGLFQFLPSTWATTPYARRSIWSAKWQSFAAAWMHTRGRQREWVCN